MMVANIYMFIYSSVRLYNMQKSIQMPGKNSPYKYSKSKYSVNKSGSESGDRHLSRKLSRADSGIEGSVVLSRSDSETDEQQGGQSDVCHSPAEDEVFSFSQEGNRSTKAMNYAKSLSSRIPRAKLAKQMSKISSHKDR